MGGGADGPLGGGADGPRARLAELVAALSLGVDLGFGQPMEHVLRQCLIAVPPWRAAVAGQAFTPPTRRGVPRLRSDEATGRCPVCARALPRRLDGCVIAHKTREGRCEGSGQPPAEDIALASWLPLVPGLTPHGLRHGHQTWMDEDRIAEVLKAERMGHDVPGMRGVYSHVSDAMRAELTTALQERWAASLRERARLVPRLVVPVLDALLTGATATPGQDRLPNRSQNRTRARTKR